MTEQEQINTIKMRLEDVKELGEDAIKTVLTMFIMDMEFSRSAICRAEKEFRTG